MRILIADDDGVCLSMLEELLRDWGHSVVAVPAGDAAWEHLQGPDAPHLAILDWMMPGMDGLEICRNLRKQPENEPTYLILLTVRGGKQNIVTGLSVGADDFITKPFDPDELQARINVGIRIVELEKSRAERLKQLEAAVEQVKRLEGLLPICMYCKRIRDDQNYWHQLEQYITDRSEARFSHGICPECYESAMQAETDS